MDSIYRDAMPDIFATVDDFDPESLKVQIPVEEDADDVETITP